MFDTFCRLANRVPGLFVGKVPMVPTDEVRFFDKATHYELRLWSVTFLISKPEWLRRRFQAPARWDGSPSDRAPT